METDAPGPEEESRPAARTEDVEIDAPELEKESRAITPPSGPM